MNKTDVIHALRHSFESRTLITKSLALYQNEEEKKGAKGGPISMLSIREGEDTAHKYLEKK